MQPLTLIKGDQYNTAGGIYQIYRMVSPGNVYSPIGKLLFDIKLELIKNDMTTRKLRMLSDDYVILIFIFRLMALLSTVIGFVAYFVRFFHRFPENILYILLFIRLGCTIVVTLILLTIYGCTTPGSRISRDSIYVNNGRRSDILDETTFNFRDVRHTIVFMMTSGGLLVLSCLLLALTISEYFGHTYIDKFTCEIILGSFTIFLLGINEFGLYSLNYKYKQTSRGVIISAPVFNTHMQDVQMALGFLPGDKILFNE